MYINYNKCFSVKNKKSSIQCVCNKKNNSFFCGRHIKMKKIIYFNNILKSIIKIQSIIRNKCINKINNVSFQNICIIKIQSIFRKYNIYRRNKCINKIDCISLQNIYNISPIYLYIYNQQDINKYYAFDIRHLNEMIKSPYVVNPYTNGNINKNDKYDIKTYIKNISKLGYIIEIKKDKLSDEQYINSYTVETFQKINVLGNYTNPTWFLDLNLRNLKKLYNNSLYIIHQQFNITLIELKKYIKKGYAFGVTGSSIRKIKKKNKLRYMILNEYNEFLDYKLSTDANKQTALMWLLTALTKVSKNAYYGLLHLV